MASRRTSPATCRTDVKGQIATHALIMLLLITISGPAWASPASLEGDLLHTQSKGCQGRLHHRKLQQHNVHDLEHLAELEAEAAHQLRLHHYTQAHDHVSSEAHPEASHHHNQPADSSSHDDAADSTPHSHSHAADSTSHNHAHAADSTSHNDEPDSTSHNHSHPADSTNHSNTDDSTSQIHSHTADSTSHSNADDSIGQSRSHAADSTSHSHTHVADSTSHHDADDSMGQSHSHAADSTSHSHTRATDSTSHHDAAENTSHSQSHNHAVDHTSHGHSHAADSTSHGHNLTANSTNHSDAADSTSHSHQNQHSAQEHQDIHAVHDDDANRPESYFTAPTVNHVLFPNSPNRTENDTDWHGIHQSFVDTLATGQKFDLILYGDSIFESFLGSVVGHPVPRAANNPAVWSQFHNTETDKIFALAGDSAFEMVWRLENGETPAVGQAKKVVLLIGSNDLDYYWDELVEDDERQEAVKKVVRDVTRCMDILAGSCPGTEVFVMSLIHKGVRWDEPDTKHNLPNRYTVAIDAINEELEQAAASWPDDQVTFVECSYIFVGDWDTEGRASRLNPDWVPDVLHPNAPGFTKLLEECIEPALHDSL